MSDALPLDETLCYPAGRFVEPADALSPAEIDAAVAEIAAFPAALRAAAEALGPDALETPYRPGGWTARQVVHHVGDSHMQALLRFKWALTEDDPKILAYDEGACATLGDTHLPVGVSLALAEALHARWVAVMRAMTPGDWARCYVHPMDGPVRLDRAAAMYAWHGRHHLAHLRLAAGLSLVKPSY